MRTSFESQLRLKQPVACSIADIDVVYTVGVYGITERADDATKEAIEPSMVPITGVLYNK